jgi:UDP-glucose 4-epimerase
LEADVADESFVPVVAQLGPDTIVHLAASVGVRQAHAATIRDARTNILGAINVGLAASECNAHVVYTASGGTMYGNGSGTVVSEDSAVDPVGAHGLSKWAAESYLQMIGARTDFKVTSLAIANVYGPISHSGGAPGIVWTWLNKMISGGKCVIYGDGSKVRDFIYIDDVADAIARVVKLSQALDPFTRINIGSGIKTTIRELHSCIASVVDAPDDPYFLDDRPEEAQEYILNIDEANRLLDWRPRTLLRDGLFKTASTIKPVRQ